MCQEYKIKHFLVRDSCSSYITKLLIPSSPNTTPLSHAKKLMNHVPLPHAKWAPLIYYLFRRLCNSLFPSISIPFSLSPLHYFSLSFSLSLTPHTGTYIHIYTHRQINKQPCLKQASLFRTCNITVPDQTLLNPIYNIPQLHAWQVGIVVLKTKYILWQMSQDQLRIGIGKPDMH